MLDFRTFTETIQIFSIIKTEGDLGKEVTTYTDLGLFPASVDVMTGTKALFYQEKGFGHGVTIKIRHIPQAIGKIIWNGKTIYPRSVVQMKLDKQTTTRGNYLQIDGGYKDGEG